jgi:aminoglycoside N3'-acetyltransferase
MERPARTTIAVASDLRALGLRHGDLIMVHASLRAVGPVAGGADGLIDAIRDTVGAAGTMLMVLGAQDDHAWVNERPEDERATLLAGAAPFDAARTPAAADVGVLAEVFRVRPETRVSDHPEARFAAAGPLADALLIDVPWDDYFGPGSPLERLLLHHGRVLRLGADANTVTALHHAEYLTKVAPKRRVRRHRLVLGSAGPEIRTVDCLDDEAGIVDYDGEDYFADILHDYLRLDRAATGLVGDAKAELLEAADIVGFGVRWMDEHLVGAGAVPKLER